jgi:hypothetical protein
VSASDLVAAGTPATVFPTSAPPRHDFTPVPVSLLAVVAAVATWIATRHGPQLSPDSVTYLSLARNLSAGRGFVDLTGQANTTFAPGLPGLLAIGQLVGLSLATAARLVNAAAFATIVVLAWVLLARHFASRAVALIATAIVVVSPALLDVTSHTWSEPVFCVVVLGFILVLEEALGRPDVVPQRVFTASAGVLAGVGFMIRYAGASLILVGLIVVLLGTGAARARLGRVGIFLAGALPLPLLWLARNAASGASYLLGPRMQVPDSVGSLLETFGKSFVSLFTYGSSLGNYLVALAPVTLLVGFGAVVATGRHESSDHHSAPSMLPLVAFIACYGASVVVSAKTAGSSIDDRIVMPIFVPVVVVSAWLASRALTAARQARNVWAGTAVAVVALGIALSAIVTTVHFIEESWTTGRAAHGYATYTLARSPLARAVAHHATLSALVTTNSPWTLYSATGHEPILVAPEPLYPSASLVPTSSDALADLACHETVYFAWYARSAHPATNLGGGLRLTSVQRARDGVLYAVHAPRSECREHHSP